jgi:hypothetical protein
MLTGLLTLHTIEMSFTSPGSPRLRAPSVLLVVTLALIVVIQAVVPARAAPKVQGNRHPDAEKLALHEKVLRRSDRTGMAKTELKAVRTWLVLAGWLGDEGAKEQQRRILKQTALQLDLAQRLITVALLKADVDRLERSLVRTKRSIVEAHGKIKKRKALLNVLRRTR